MQRRYKRGPYTKHGLICPFCAAGRLRRRGTELPQPDGILLSLRRCTILVVAALFILPVSLCCSNGTPAPAITFGPASTAVLAPTLTVPTTVPVATATPTSSWEVRNLDPELVATLKATPTFGSNPLPPFPSPNALVWPSPATGPLATPTWAVPPTAPTWPVPAAVTPTPSWAGIAERAAADRALAKCLKEHPEDSWVCFPCGTCAVEPSPTPTPTAIPPGDVPWPTLLDGQITFRLEPLTEPLDGSYDLTGWIMGTIESNWGIVTSSVPPLEDPSTGTFSPADLVITFEDELNYDGQEVCAVTSRPTSNSGGICYVTLSRRCWDREFIYEDVPEKTLLHEVGHCMGLGDGGRGVMAIPIQNWTTEEDIRGIYETYGLDY